MKHNWIKQIKGSYMFNVSYYEGSPENVTGSSEYEVTLYKCERCGSFHRKHPADRPYTSLLSDFGKDWDGDCNLELIRNVSES